MLQASTGFCADFVRPDCTICSCEQPCDGCGQAVCMCMQLASAAQALSAALQQQQQQKQPPTWPPVQQQPLAPQLEAGRRIVGMAEAFPPQYVATSGKGRRSPEQGAADEQEAAEEAAEEAGARAGGRGRGGKRRKLAAKYTGVVEK